MFTFRQLDDETRRFMRAEVDYDLQGPGVYMSTRFTDAGRDAYLGFLLDAVSEGDDASLAAQFVVGEHILLEELRKGRPVRVPVTAAQTFAEGEFNRFYLRAICLRALSHGSNVVEIYRAKAVTNPRAESVAMVGSRLPASTLLDDLRTNIGVDAALKIPPGPNSGLSAFCVCEQCWPLEVGVAERV